MKVAIDFREAVRQNPAGKGEYVYQLCRHLLLLNPNVEFILLTCLGQTVNLPAGNWRQKSFGRGLGWHIGVWFWLELLRPVDLYFSTTSVIIPACLRSVPCVTTLFDFTAWRYPKTHLTRAVWLEKIFMGMALKSSHHLLAISNFTKQEAITLFGICSDKITVAPLAADESYRPLELDENETVALRKKYSLPDEFILYLGMIEPRKNVGFLVQAYQKIQPQIPDTKLVLAGGKGWYADRILKLADSNIIAAGYVDREDKPALYNLAKLFVFPSFYEGFGLPPLEAMACGTATIVSGRASLPEVVDGGAKIVSIEEVGDLADAMLKLLQSPDERRELSRRGISRSKQFSWQRTAEQTWKVLCRYE